MNNKTAFVLGGGGYLGGYQAGMLRALFERGIAPDLVIGTSIGSIQGAMIAKDPTPSVLTSLDRMWDDVATMGVMKVRLGGLLSNAIRLNPAMATQDVLRTLLIRYLGEDTRIEDLPVPYQAAAASIERATVRYFDSGPLLPALLASAAVPGLWPPVQIGDEHYVDGGVVETVPVTRAIAYGATTIYVLRLRQREPALSAPRWPWQLGQVVYEVARRHRLGQVIHTRPPGVVVHLIPTGEEFLEPPDNGVHTSLREQRDTIKRRIEQGYRSACDYLDAAPGTRKSATIHAKSRGTGFAHVPRPGSPAIAARIRHHFRQFDLDHDGRISEQEFTATADRICAAFGHAGEGQRTTRLHATYQGYWAALCQAAETDPAGSLDQDAFQRGLAALAGDGTGYDANLLPVVEAVIATADRDGDGVLNPAEISTLLAALGVTPAEAHLVALRLDTNGDGVISIDEFDEAFRDYFTSDEPDCVGSLLFGTTEPQETESQETEPQETEPQVTGPRATEEPSLVTG